jgi:hypothetical protein
MKKMMFTLAFIFLTTLVCLAQEPANQDVTKEAAPQEKTGSQAREPLQDCDGLPTKRH